MSPKSIQYEIKTERLFLRPKRMEDVSRVFEILNENPEMTRFMSFDPPEKIEDTQKFFLEKEKEFPEKSVVWSIFFQDKLVGIISLEDICRTQNAWKIDRAELGYWLDPLFHGQGIMTEAGQAVLAFGFEKLGLHKITVGHLPQNSASQRVIEKLGFRFVGELRDHFFRFGQWWNDKQYEMIVDEFQKQDS